MKDIESKLLNSANLG